MRRTIGFSASERAFHACQSLFTLRQTRLTMSLLTAPPNRAPSARQILSEGRFRGHAGVIRANPRPFGRPHLIQLILHCSKLPAHDRKLAK